MEMLKEKISRYAQFHLSFEGTGSTSFHKDIHKTGLKG